MNKTKPTDESHQHSMEYKSEVVRLHDANRGWFDAKRIIIFCTTCGFVSHDVTNSNDSHSQNYSHG